MKYILGSGLIAFIAKTIHPEYQIIPVGKTRYYQHDIATCDNYIICDDQIDKIIKNITKKQPESILFQRAMSYSGSILFNYNIWYNNWILHVYKDPHPNYNQSPLRKNTLFVYDTTCTQLFEILEKPMLQTCKEFIVNQEKIISINENNIITSKQILPYEHIINTIPLNSLLDYMNISHNLESYDLHTFVVETDALDFEGATELLVLDENIDFYKCTYLGNNKYQFYSHVDINNLNEYLKHFMSNFHLLNGVCTLNAIPIGDPTSISLKNITNIGSNAQWNDHIDVNQCITQLYRMK